MAKEEASLVPVQEVTEVEQLHPNYTHTGILTSAVLSGLIMYLTFTFYALLIEPWLFPKRSGEKSSTDPVAMGILFFCS